MFKVGCSEEILDVLLFVELYGYGFFAGRRNRGVHDPLYCRAFSFNDGERRAMIIYTDICTTDDLYAREMRAKIAGDLHIEPDYITLIATHTHSGPALGVKCGYGFGEPNPAFQQIWKRAVMEVAAAAIRDEEEISHAEVGEAPLSNKLGKNRVVPEENITDESIRWVKFLRSDGSCKVLLHSHGIHGIAMNGSYAKLVSADWMGAVNRMIKERKLADMPLFMLGPCGDINTYTSCIDLKNDTAADVIASQYISDLGKNFACGGEKFTDLKLSASFKTVRLPYVKQTAKELLSDAKKFRSINEYEGERANRIEEMVLLLENGADLTRLHDFQVLGIGEISLMFIPGEFFVEDGAKLMEESVSNFPIAVTVANGNGGYFPSFANMKRYPTVDCKKDKLFGFYEVYSYPVALRFKYTDDVAEFVSSQLLDLERESRKQNFQVIKSK